ncbi:Endoglucanase H precursor [Synechococcus sp. MIT S9509]|uniref:hypothetical protein n=1 Tax=Synechococcus sp. MIT S9509 TaxID=1801630 RepID=UPI0007BAFF4A|nr:hypothetical protein [Synechococcus sp. MIT S9509]KZR88270.1 Endoglucanase H precursor [Synechococcus sp. MIT S9509]
MNFLVKENDAKLATLSPKSFSLLTLIISLFCVSTGVGANEIAPNNKNITTKKKYTFGLNKGVLFNNASQDKVSNWSSSYHKKYMNELGIRNAVLHYNINLSANKKQPLDWIYKNYIDPGIDTTVTLLLKLNNQDPEDIKAKAKEEGFHSLILDGYYDQQLINIGKIIASKKKKIRLSLFHEGNGGWYEWGMCAKGNTQNSLIKSLKHTIKLINSTGAAQYIKYDFNFNRSGCDGVFKKADQYLPQIADIVDRITVSTYNRCGTASRYKKEKQFASEFSPAYVAIAKYTNKPIHIAETATSGLCGDRIEWYKSLFNSLKKFPQLTGINFFFGDVPKGLASNDVPIRWGLNSEQEKKQFKAIIAKYTPKQTGRNPLESNENTFLKFSSMPWGVWMEVANEFKGPYTKSLNPITMRPFGKKDFTIMTNANQRFYWGEKGTFEHGPGISFLGAYSSNKDRWWFNQVFPQLTYGIRLSALTKHLGQYDASRVELYLGYRKYYVAAPEGSEGIEGGIRALFIFGGDHVK